MRRADKIKLKFFLLNLIKGMAALGGLLITYRLLIDFVDIKEFTAVNFIEDLSIAFIFIVFF